VRSLSEINPGIMVIMTFYQTEMDLFQKRKCLPSFPARRRTLLLQLLAGRDDEFDVNHAGKYFFFSL